MKARDPRDNLLIASLMTGATIPQAAEASGYSNATIDRRLRDPEFSAALERALERQLERVMRSVASAATAAVQTLLLAMTREDVPWSTRVSAARTVVENACPRGVVITGPGGGPIMVEAVTPTDELLARLERLAPQPVIEATSHLVD